MPKKLDDPSALSGREQLELAAKSKQYARQLDAEIAPAIKKLRSTIERFDTKHRAEVSRLIPGFDTRNPRHFAQLCGMLAHHVNMSAEDVADLSLPALYGLIDAMASVPQAGDDAARAGASIDVACAAARLEASERSVRNWCNNKTEPCHRAFKQGKTWRIPEADIPA